jgi:hypothetical protein
MENLSRLFRPTHFARAFDAANGDIGFASKPIESVMWLQGGVGVAGRGFAWGHGQMNYRGVNYPFGVSSLSVADADSVGVYAVGRVMQLSRIGDFEGRYLASGAGSAAAGGGHATHLRNERGVVIELVVTDAARASSRSIEALCVRLKGGMAGWAA